MIDCEQLYKIMNAFCSVIHLFYQESRIVVAEIICTPLYKWLLCLSQDVFSMIEWFII